MRARSPPSPGNSHLQQPKLTEKLRFALKIHGKLRQLDTWAVRGGAKSLVTWTLETSGQVGLPLGQLVTLSELSNLSELRFPPLQTAGNNAHLTGLVGGLSGINYVEVFGTVPGAEPSEQLA